MSPRRSTSPRRRPSSRPGRARGRRDRRNGRRALDLQLGDDGRRVHAPYLDCTLRREPAVRRTAGTTWSSRKTRPRTFMGANGELPTWARSSSTTRPTSSASSTTRPPTQRRPGAAEGGARVVEQRLRIRDRPALVGNSHYYSTAPAPAVWRRPGGSGRHGALRLRRRPDVSDQRCPAPSAATPAYP